MLLWMGLVLLPLVLLLSLVCRLVCPSRRLRWISAWARFASSSVLGLLSLGGARFVRSGHVDSDQPGIIVMNHQSGLDILNACLMAGPLVPAFVARERYLRAPMVGTGLRLAECPVIDPHKDREGAIVCLQQAMARDRALLIYPESHRSRDGELQPFRTAGLLSMLKQRRVPVWLLVTDGVWNWRTLRHMLWGVHRIRSRTELVGRFDPPEDENELSGFVETLRDQMSLHLARMRLSARALR